MSAMQVIRMLRGAVMKNSCLCFLLGLVILRSAMQVIRMLRGAQDPGPAFRLDRRSGSFTANSDTHVPHLSHSSLHHMLGGFAAAGTDLLK